MSIKTMKQKVLNIILILLILSSCTTASQQSGINRFRDYQKENLSCKYFAGAMMTDKNLYLDVDDWGYDEFEKRNAKNLDIVRVQRSLMNVLKL